MEHMIPIRRIIEFKEFHSANRKILHGIRSKLFISESTFIPTRVEACLRICNSCCATNVKKNLKANNRNLIAKLPKPSPELLLRS
jgi:hypothetical protein